LPAGLASAIIAAVAGIFGSSGRTANPLGVIGVLTGAIGAAFSVVLWIHHFNPDTTILGSYSAQIAAGGTLADQLRMLAAAFGLMAVLSGIISGLGGRGSGTTVAALLLGIVGLSYPVLTYLNVVTRFVPNPVR
jgi:hypothetical protein